MITAEKLYEKLKDIQVGNPVCRFTQEHCELLLPTISRIEDLKRDKNAIILVHNYVAPQIQGYGQMQHVLVEQLLGLQMTKILMKKIVLLFVLVLIINRLKIFYHQ